MNPIATRLLSQQLIGRQFTSPEEVVDWMGALQAQEYKMMRWAVGMRMVTPRLSAFKAAFDEGRIVRTHLFRTTWQLVSAADARWMLALCREKSKRAINGYLNYYGDSIDEKEYISSCRLIERFLSHHSSATHSQVAQHFADSGREVSAHHLSVLLRRAEIEGIICNGPLTDNRENTYSLLDRKVPPTPPLTKDESLALLSRKYFRSHSPATLADFVWWSGLSVSDCRNGIHAIAHELSSECYQGETYYLHDSCRHNGFRRRTIHLLPSYDEYLIAYKSRHISLSPEHRHYAHDQKGIFHPVLLMGGEAVGNWKCEKGKYSCSFFTRHDEVDPEQLQQAIDNHRRFLLR